ncbi:uncharacterized protein MONBRDRAFT_23982 [Monosiga brevicollis MX1]|uniref:Anaphase-promoting complex subunit 4 WD40 domain-containing protein n=1 Tax=Monosiga brevicollis TaxID=81824 RepID=A9UUC5_MONBE|nr:uncharacterized protein MONBRDRAFT_23982 [Monosiga brevicollis MX1]EDQ90880.1 predicted protein [Monosiga brevicollis MX1]|eukprot:XP_001744177.1 hypothetical protein [Monosiga brevicollis MX1]
MEGPDGTWLPGQPHYGKPLLTRAEACALAPPSARLSLYAGRGGHAFRDDQESGEGDLQDNDSTLALQDSVAEVEDSFLICNHHTIVTLYTNDDTRGRDIHTGSIKQRPLCHDGDIMTRERDFFRLAIGYNTGEILIWEYYRNERTWLNDRKTITDLAVASDCQSVACVDLGGRLSVYTLKFAADTVDIKLSFAADSYYGGFTCCCWSSDDKYLATGSQDDLISVWSVTSKSLLARGEGHTAYVARIKFDPYAALYAFEFLLPSTYRLISVGQDGKIAFWDFSESDLSVPLRPPSATAPLQPAARKTTRRLRLRRKANVVVTTNSQNNDILKAPSRREVATIRPVAIQQVSSEPVTDVHVQARRLWVVVNTGQIHQWERPKASQTTAV